MIDGMMGRLAGCFAVAGVVGGLLVAVSTVRQPTHQHQVYKTAGLWSPLSHQSFTRQ